MAKKEQGEFDINAIAAEFIKINMERFVDLGADILKLAKHKMQLNLNKTYKAYLKSLFEKCSKTKSFFIRGEPVYLYKFYVPLSVKCGASIIEGVGFKEMPRCSIIIASGGSGKSMLMKHLVLSAILQKNKVPIFIQLERINRENIDLNTLIKR